VRRRPGLPVRSDSGDRRAESEAESNAGEYLDRHVATELRIARAIHLAHTAFADRRDNDVRIDLGVGGNGVAHEAYPEIKAD
jgi:hypothetical protein